MPFATRDVTVRSHSAKLWELTQPLGYRGKDDNWIVPAGFMTDFASVPAVVTWLIPTFGQYTLAAILHDWFCSVEVRTGGISARDADGVFRRIMRELGVPPVRRWLIWTGVRWGALFNPIRRPGWRYDAFPVLAISLLTAPIVVPAGILATVALLVYSFIEWIVSLFHRA